ncbi:MAG TPA: hypothetical protein VLO10_02450 [Candidatus Deferrimicrobium sp.]|nr:hypothetical protein [Candidatus Deferrimicrobium sp.]
MTTGWLIVNIVLVAVVAAIVAVPAVLIPNLLDREVHPQAAQRSTQSQRLSAPSRRWASDGERTADAA